MLQEWTVQCLTAIKPEMSAGEAETLFERLIKARSIEDSCGMLQYSLGRTEAMQRFAKLSWW